MELQRSLKGHLGIIGKQIGEPLETIGRPLGDHGGPLGNIRGPLVRF